MKFLKAHWPTILSLAGTALTYALPGLQALVAAHPKSTISVLLGALIAAYNSTAPKDKAQLAR